jgi:hypothetical protein
VTSTLEQYILILYIIFIFTLILCGVLLLECTNEDSISGMVAQRWNRTSYVTILIITGLSFFTCCFIIAGGIARTRLHKSNTEWTIVLASISPILAFLILVFPIGVSKTAADLGMIPLPANPLPRRPNNLGHNEYEILFYPWCNCWTTRLGIWSPCVDWLCCCCLFRCCWPSCSVRAVHRLLHFLAVGSGLLCGWISVGYNFNTTPYRTSGTVGLIYLVTSCVTCFSFIAAGIFDVNHAPREVKRLILYLEYVGLFYYMMSIIHTSIISGDLIQPN